MIINESNLHNVAGLLVTEVNSVLKNVLHALSEIQSSIKSDNSVVTQIDVALQNALRQRLTAAYPSVAFLGEEMQPDTQRELLNHAHGCWCLDPIDGTTNFANRLPFFAVSLGFILKGQAHMAVVYDPERNECFTALRNKGAWLNEHPLQFAAHEHGDSLSNCIAVVDFKRLPAQLASRLVTHPPYRSQRNLGSCALEWCWLAMRRFQVYLHGGQKIWDYCAGELIARETGCRFVTLTGDEVFDLSLDKRSVVASSSETLFEEWRTYLTDSKPA